MLKDAQNATYLGFLGRLWGATVPCYTFLESSCSS